MVRKSARLSAKEADDTRTRRQSRPYSVVSRDYSDRSRHSSSDKHSLGDSDVFEDRSSRGRQASMPDETCKITVQRSRKSKTKDAKITNHTDKKVAKKDRKVNTGDIEKSDEEAVNDTPVLNSGKRVRSLSVSAGNTKTKKTKLTPKEKQTATSPQREKNAIKSSPTSKRATTKDKKAKLIGQVKPSKTMPTARTTKLRRKTVSPTRKIAVKKTKTRQRHKTTIKTTKTANVVRTAKPRSRKTAAAKIAAPPTLVNTPVRTPVRTPARVVNTTVFNTSRNQPNVNIRCVNNNWQSFPLSGLANRGQGLRSTARADAMMMPPPPPPPPRVSTPTKTSEPRHRPAPVQTNAGVRAAVYTPQPGPSRDVYRENLTRCINETSIRCLESALPPNEQRRMRSSQPTLLNAQISRRLNHKTHYYQDEKMIRVKDALTSSKMDGAYSEDIAKEWCSFQPSVVDGYMERARLDKLRMNGQLDNDFIRQLREDNRKNDVNGVNNCYYK